MDANEKNAWASDMFELNSKVFSDAEETEGETEEFLFHHEADSGDIPPSLLSYFKTSKSRAAVCEKLILEELEDFPALHHAEDLMNSPFELDKDTMKPSEQIICDPENEENNTSSDTRLLPAPTETHNVSVCPNNEDQVERVEYMESERQFLLELEAEREKRRCEETKLEEQKRQIERDFQSELRRIMEAEKLQQRELELMARRAQEKLEEEFLLQQELMSNLKRRVEEERRMREEEQKRMKEKRIKEEEERRMREEEQKMMKEEEERRMREEEQKRMKEKRIKEEEERRMREEEQKRMKEKRIKEEEERRMREEEQKRMKEEKRIKDKEERKMREEEQKRIKDEEEKRKREGEKVKMEAERERKEERRMIEEEQKRIKEEKRKREEKVKIEAERMRIEEEMRMKKEEERKIEELRLKKEQEKKHVEEETRRREALEKKKLEDEMRMMKEEEERKRKENEERLKKEEEERKKIEAARRKMETEKRRMEEEESKKREERNMIIEEELRKSEEIEKLKQKEESEKKEEEEALKKMCVETREGDERQLGNADEEMKLEERRKKEEKDRKRREEEARKWENERKKEGENGIIIKEPRPVEEDEGRRKKEERKRRQNEEMRCEDVEEQNLKKDKQQQDVDNREMGQESKTEDNFKEEQRKSVVAEKRLNEEEVNKEREEEVRLKIKEEKKKREVHDRETGEIVIKANDLQEERENKEETGNTAASSIWTSSSPGPSHSESTNSPVRTESTPPRPDPEEGISQTATVQTVEGEQRAARPSVVPVSLPEHTEDKRLSWMKDCISWSRLSLQNRRKQNGSVRVRRGLRGAAEGCSLPPLCPDSLLQAAGWKSLQEVTTVTLEDLPGCSLSTLAQCVRLQSLTLRRCGLRSLEGVNQLPQLRYIDVQENDISFVDCENMRSLRVLQLSHNKLTSIHGLNGAENLDVLDLSHNSITRIAGLESMRRLQRLSVDHNQLISTKGLRDVYTLLHLNCSHNHLAAVEGLENSALLDTLDLRANSLSEAPSLNNQVLLRDLHLEDNSIWSLQGLAACWLPLMQHLSVAQNRITQLPSMSDFVSLVNLDLRFNCLSELQNVCESLEGCGFLREVHLTGNPLQQESGWSSTLQRAVPGLRASGDQQTDSCLTPPAALQVSSASGGFLMLCQAQQQQTQDLQQQHSRELSDASSSLDAVEISCRHFSESLQLAKQQRFAHEYGDTTVAAGQTTPEETLDMDSTECPEDTEMDFTRKAQPVPTNRDKCSYRAVQGSSAVENQHDTFATVAAASKTEPGSVHCSVTKGKTTSSSLKMSPVSDHQNLVRQNTAAVVIQQLWRKYRQKCGNISSVSTAERGGGGEPESGPTFITRSVVGQDHAATVIQAFWRGFALRRRLASALAAVTCTDSGEDDTFEEVDVDEFVFDEAAIEKPWTLSFSEDSPPRRYTLTEQLPPLKPPVHFPEPPHYVLPPPLVRRPKQAWVPEEQVNSALRVSPESASRSKSPASTSVPNGLSERSEKILEEWGFTDSHTALQMLKRAQNMKPAKQQQKKRRDPSVRLALFRNCGYQLGPVEAHNRPVQPGRKQIKGVHAPFQPPSSIQAAIQPHQTSVLMSEGHKVGEAERGLQQAERGKQRLHTQAAQPDRDPESEHFLPEISSDILNGGRVQLVADPGYTERLHHASGLGANNSLAAQPCKENNYPRRNSLGHARTEVPSPQRVKSAPSRKERISFRDNPVRLSGGWGGGKKRDRVHK